MLSKIFEQYVNIFVEIKGNIYYKSTLSYYKQTISAVKD